MGRPAGNYGALTMGSGKEVADEERATTENELGRYRAGSGFSKLKTAGESTGREARRARQQADRHIITVRDEEAASNLIGANTLATLPSAPGRGVLGGDSRTNRGGRIGITGRVGGRGGERGGGRGAGPGP